MNNQDIKFLLETLDDIKGSLRTIAKAMETIPNSLENLDTTLDVNFENLINSINKEE